MLKDIDVYYTFTAFKLHFTDKHYNINKYSKPHINHETFERSRYKAITEKILKRYTDKKSLQNVVISGLIRNHEMQIQDILDDGLIQEAFNKFVKYQNRQSYYFNEELNQILTILKEINLSFKDWLYGGAILNWYSCNKISHPTFMSLDYFTNFLTKGEQNNIVFNQFHRFFCLRYKEINNIPTVNWYKSKELQETFINFCKTNSKKGKTN